jgi:LmbE family N-acetylglucosaminyl deacetylase
VVAHPDDEYYCAATVYRIAQELGGTVDQVVVTNGEGGFHYTQLAEKFYGVALADEQSRHARLPDIRKSEVLRAGGILGIRRHYFLDQHDDGFTLDPRETLERLWERDRVLKFLAARLAEERYNFVFVVLPRWETHGQHKAATLLALEAISRMAPEVRPIVLAAEPGLLDDPAARFEGVVGYRLSRPASATPVLQFDRTKSFGYHNALRYEIVVNWVIAEHKSQGLFQNDCNRHDVERFWLFTENLDGALGRVRGLDRMLSGQLTGESIHPIEETTAGSIGAAR